MSLQFCDLHAQYQKISKDLNKKIQTVFEQSKFIMGPEVAELENKLKEYVNIKHAISCANGTDALTLALMAIGLKPGDEVIMPAFTYFATAEACMLLNGIPVFVDVEESTFNINAQLIEKKITSKTKAIIHVSLFGQCSDIELIQKIAKKHNLYVIEDAAQSFGATYKGNKSCSISDISCTSFFPSKPLGCYGDGGMCFTNDDEIAIKLKSLRIHGQGKRYYHELIGMNSRLDTLQAAILLAKIAIFDDEVILRQKVAENYNKLLDGVLESPYISPFNTSVYAQYTLKHPKRDFIIEKMKDKGIPTMIYYPLTLPMQTAITSSIESYATLDQEKEYPVSTKLSQIVFSLPMHPYLKIEEQEFISRELKSILEENL
jgi:UDP-2-acetamido-2-deoxy-ribo-hexuluronate aminotransferase